MLAGFEAVDKRAGNSFSLLSQVRERSGLAEFWPLPHSQLYDEPARLAEAGLLVEQREQLGRRRRIYHLTDTGRGALREWVRDPEVGLGFKCATSPRSTMFFSELDATEADVATTAKLQSNSTASG
jgi:PadR family transcriptional regulator, regulatory protein AphA